MYSVMADCGAGEFLWVARSTEEGRVGANAFSLMDAPDDQNLISEDLYRQFVDWASIYMATQPRDAAVPRTIDWESFNREGMALTRLLKEELGASANVQYLRAGDDPDRRSPVLLVLAEFDG
jgi:hypothetical protein